MTRRAIVLCNGEPPSRALLHHLVRNADLLVAADGGANVARSCGLRPDVIIGDLDSITPATRRWCGSSRIIHVPRQDNTDLEKALDFLLRQGIRDVVIAGATGKRLDFTLGNLSVAWLHAHRMSIRYVGDGWEAKPLKGRNRVEAQPGTTVSLIPFGSCEGITLRGLQYPLTNAALSRGAVAVSNVVVRSPFSVSIRRGRLLLVLLAPHRGRQSPP
jgi:thiamine pyrophosphokinase